jgi:hypothetical protein
LKKFRFTVLPAVELFNYWTIRKAVQALSRISRWVFSVIINIGGRRSEAAIKATGARSVLFCLFISQKKTVARSAWARTRGQNTLAIQ